MRRTLVVMAWVGAVTLACAAGCSLLVDTSDLGKGGEPDASASSSASSSGSSGRSPGDGTSSSSGFPSSSGFDPFEAGRPTLPDGGTGCVALYGFCHDAGDCCSGKCMLSGTIGICSPF